jgi:hypothetical protein
MSARRGHTLAEVMVAAALFGSLSLLTASQLGLMDFGRGKTKAHETFDNFELKTRSEYLDTTRMASNLLNAANKSKDAKLLQCLDYKPRYNECVDVLNRNIQLTPLKFEQLTLGCLIKSTDQSWCRDQLEWADIEFAHIPLTLIRNPVTKEFENYGGAFDPKDMSRPCPRQLVPGEIPEVTPPHYAPNCTLNVKAKWRTGPAQTIVVGFELQTLSRAPASTRLLESTFAPNRYRALIIDLGDH